MIDMERHDLDGRIAELLAYVAWTCDAEIGGVVAVARPSVADMALALANDSGATADVVTACVQAVKDASATFYADPNPGAPTTFDDVLQDLIDRARNRDANRSMTPDEAEAEAI